MTAPAILPTGGGPGRPITIPRAAADATAFTPLPRGIDVQQILADAHEYMRQRPLDTQTADDYVAEQTGGAAKSVAELEQHSQYNLPNVARAAGMGASFGFLDELAGLWRARAQALPALGMATQNPAGALGLLAPTLASPEYAAGRASVLNPYSIFQAAHPNAEPAIELGGGLLTPGMGELGDLFDLGRVGMSPVRAGLRASAVGAGAGALAGAGYAPTAEDVPGSAAQGGVAGGVLGFGLGMPPQLLRELRGSGALRMMSAIHEAGGESALRESAARLAAAGRGGISTLADLDPQLAGAGEFSATYNPTVFNKYQPAFLARNLGQGERLMGDLTSILGEQPDAAVRRAALDVVRKKVGDQYATLAAQAPSLTGISDIEGPVQQLVQSGRLSGRALGAARQALKSGSYQDYNNLRQLLGETREQMWRSVTGPSPHPGVLPSDARAVGDAQEALDNGLRQHVPGFADLQSQYRQAVLPIQALDKAEDFLGKPDLRDLQRQFDGMTPDEQNQLRYGMASTMVKELNDVAPGKNAARRYMYPSPNLQAKLQMVFGTQDQYQQWLARVAAEHQLSQAGGIFGGSPTARRMAAEVEPTENLRETVSPHGVATKLFARVPILSSTARNNRVAMEMAPWLFNPMGAAGPDAVLDAVRRAAAKASPGALSTTLAPATAGLLLGSQAARKP